MTVASAEPNRVYRSQLGNLHMNGGVFYDTAETALTGTFAQLNGVAGLPAIATFSIAKGLTSNISLVTVQFFAPDGTTAIAVVSSLFWYLSDSATGAGVTATTASGAVGAGLSGADIVVLTAKKATVSVTDATGKYILSITDTAKTGFYVAVTVGGVVYVSRQLVAGDYD